MHVARAVQQRFKFHTLVVVGEVDQVAGSTSRHLLGNHLYYGYHNYHDSNTAAAAASASGGNSAAAAAAAKNISVLEQTAISSTMSSSTSYMKGKYTYGCSQQALSCQIIVQYARLQQAAPLEPHA